MSVIQVRRAVFLIAGVAWLGLCALVLWALSRSAATATSIDEYARAPGFQVVNFAVGYLPYLVSLLFVVLGAEFIALRLAEPWLSRARKAQAVPARDDRTPGSE